MGVRNNSLPTNRSVDTWLPNTARFSRLSSCPVVGNKHKCVERYYVCISQKKKKKEFDTFFKHIFSFELIAVRITADDRRKIASKRGKYEAQFATPDSCEMAD